MAGKILVIDSVMPNRIILKVKLSGAGYDVLIAASSREGLDMALRERPELVILDLDMPDLSVEETMTQLRATNGMRHVQVIMVATNGGTETRLRAYRAGCDEFYAKPFNESTLLARLRSFFREDEQLRLLAAKGASQFDHDVMSDSFYEEIQPFEPKASIVILGAAEAAMRLKHRLPEQANASTAIHTPDVVTSGKGLPFATADAVVVISDNDDPNAALHMISTLRGRPQTRDARFCIQFDQASRGGDRELAFDFGADAIFMVDDHPEEIALRLASLIRRKHRADVMRERISKGLMLAMHDPLTNIPNRRYMLAAMRSFVAEAQRSNTSVAVIMCDVDRFKSVNDRFGHMVGDDVLREVAQRLNAVLRTGDLVARIGGEEFLVALPRTNMGEARSVAERLVAAISETPFSLSNGQPLVVTISAGLSMLQPTLGRPIDQSIALALDEADRAMMLSKEHGRNMITLGRSAA